MASCKSSQACRGRCISARYVLVIVAGLIWMQPPAAEAKAQSKSKAKDFVRMVDEIGCEVCTSMVEDLVHAVGEDALPLPDGDEAGARKLVDGLCGEGAAALARFVGLHAVHDEPMGFMMRPTGAVDRGETAAPPSKRGAKAMKKSCLGITDKHGAPLGRSIPQRPRVM